MSWASFNEHRTEDFMQLTRTTRLIFAGSLVVAGLAAARAQAAGPYQFVPITPCRIVDTRTGLGGYTGLLPNGLPGTKFTIKNASPCNVPGTAAAIAVNLTVADTANSGWVALFPGDQGWPGVSSINFLNGDFLANGAIVPLGAGGSLDLSALAAFQVGAAGTNMILDVTGYFVTTGGLKFYAITPCRVVDTQTGLGGLNGYLPNGLPGTKFTIKGAAPCNIPTDATAIAVNATAAQTQGQGWFALFPGTAAWPGVSNVNFFGNDTIANGAIVPVSPGANDLTVLAAYSGTPGAYLQLDLTGYFK
jgi:hypothetical protein